MFLMSLKIQICPQCLPEKINMIHAMIIGCKQSVLDVLKCIFWVDLG